MTKDERSANNRVLRSFVIWNSSTMSGPKAGYQSPRHSHDQTAGMGIVSDAGDDEPTGEKPDEHHEDGLGMEEETGGGVIFGFHPNVAKEAIDDAGHANEVG